MIRDGQYVINIGSASMADSNLVVLWPARKSFEVPELPHSTLCGYGNNDNPCKFEVQEDGELEEAYPGVLSLDSLLLVAPQHGGPRGEKLSSKHFAESTSSRFLSHLPVRSKKNELLKKEVPIVSCWC